MRLTIVALMALALLTACAAPAAPAPTSAPAGGPAKPAAPAAQPPTSAPAPAAPTSAPSPPTAAATKAPAPAAAAAPQLVGGKLPPLPDGFPKQPISVWTANPAGQADDIFAKMLAESASKYSPVRVVSANRNSGPGLQFVLIDYLKTQPGSNEGYHVWAYTLGGVMRLYTVEAIKDKNLEDTRPILSMEQAPYVFAVPKDSPFQSLKDVADYAKTRDLKVVASTTGSGLHIAALLWAKQAGIKFTFVPTESGAQSRTMLMGGGAQFGALSPEPGIEQFVRVLAFTHDRRMTDLPNVPTTKELGFDVPASTERAIATLPTVSDDHVNWLFQLFSLTAQEPEFKAQRKGFQVVVKSGVDVRKSERQILDLFVPAIRELGMATR